MLRRRGAQRRERGEIDGGVFAGDELSHDAGRRRGQEDAVAVVSSGEELVLVFGERAEDREIVGG